MAANSDKWYSRWLGPVAELYRGAAAARRQAYEEGRRPLRKLPRPVVSVGNLVVGGTGKTPMVLYLCDKLSEWCHVAILSRGYGRKNARTYLRLPKANQLDDRAALFFGDEPVMMARRLKKVAINVGPNRYRAGLNALNSDPVDLFLMDDGFQHVELHRDVDIVLLDGRDNPPDLQVLPSGPLREPAETISRADIVVITYCEADGGHRVDLDWLRRVNPTAVLATARYEVDAFIDCTGGVEIDREELRHHPLYAFSGIAHPERLLDTLAEYDLKISGHRFFADHHYFTGRQLHDVKEEALNAGADGLITTEKDSVRIRIAKLRGLPVYYPRIRMKLLSGEEAIWERIGEVLHVG